MSHIISQFQLFCCITAAMVSLNLVFVWPWCRGHWRRILLILLFLGSSAYSTYAYWGKGSILGLQHYYSEYQQTLRSKQASMRPLLMAFRKTEQRYLLKLEHNPNDREAWLSLGQIYLIQQDESRANNAFEKARQILASQSEKD